jgi:hypothetical protein
LDIAKDDMSYVDFLGPTGIGSCRVFTRTHGKEKGNNSEGRKNRGGCVMRGRGLGAAETVEGPEELWGDRFLAIGRRVKILDGVQQLLDGGTQDFVVLDVEGAWLEMLLKRPSHVACGQAHSACNHWAFTVACKSTAFRPVSCAIARDEGFGDNFDLSLG